MVTAPGPGTAACCIVGQLVCIWFNYAITRPVETTTTTTAATLRCDPPEPPVAHNWLLGVARVVLSFFAGGFIALAAFAGWAVSAGGLASLAAGSGIAAWAWRLILGRGFKRGAPGSPISPVVEGVIQPYGVDARRPYPAEIEGW